MQFNKNNELVKDAEKNYVSENEFIDSSILEGKKEGLFDNNIESFCKKHLVFLFKENVDFKNRFSFVHIKDSGEITFKEPLIYFSDLIAMYNDIDYSKLDDHDFIWSI